MKQTLKITILMVLMTIVTLTLASCDELLNKLPFGNETTPQELITIGCTTTPEPEGSTPEPDVTTTGPEETTPEAHVHTMGEWVVVKEATCVEYGVKERRCTGCDHVVTSFISAVGTHTMGNWNITVTSTCTDGGLKERKCQKCGYIETKEVDSLSHIWDLVVTVNPTSCLEEGYRESVCTRCGERKFVYWEGDHTYISNQWGICTVCNYVDLCHEHIIKDGKCKYCDYVWFALEHPSMYDNDGDGVTEAYLIAAALPEKFRSEDAIHIDAFRDELDGQNSKKWDDHWDQRAFPYPHIYCGVYSELEADDYLLYNVTVEEVGVYELVVHLYVNNDKNRCAEYIINEGTPSEYSFKTSHGWINLDSTCLDIRNNDHLKGIYMLGIRIELQAGENTIKITGCDLEKPQLFRDLYLIKAEE